MDDNRPAVLERDGKIKAVVSQAALRIIIRSPEFDRKRAGAVSSAGDGQLEIQRSIRALDHPAAPTI